MGYLHIENLYRPNAQAILAFRECYALEKIHGTSAHVRWDGLTVHLFPGGESADSFAAIFGSDLPLSPTLADLAAKFSERFGATPVTVYGEAYGGKCQKMSDTYGKRLRFVAFDVSVADCWLDVPKACDAVAFLGLEFVSVRKVATDLALLDAERDRPSEQAKRNGVGDDKPSEGVVLRPPYEVKTNNGDRVIAKHKRPEFSERKTNPPVDPSKLAVLEGAEKIADEWVTEMRLTHVLDKMGNPFGMSAIPAVIAAMTEDVLREASGEIVDSKEARKAIGSKAVAMFKRRVMTRS